MFTPNALHSKRTMVLTNAMPCLQNPKFIFKPATLLHLDFKTYDALINHPPHWCFHKFFNKFLKKKTKSKQFLNLNIGTFIHLHPTTFSYLGRHLHPIDSICFQTSLRRYLVTSLTTFQPHSKHKKIRSTQSYF